MAKIKVIDLLNKIANGEELPNEIEYGGTIYKRYGYNNKYYKNDDINREKDILSEHLANESFYNSGIKIIEEDKEMEHYDMFDYFTGYGFGGTDKELLAHLQRNFVNINQELDYLIKAVNELKKGK